MDRALSLDETLHLRYCILGRYGDHHVNMIGQQMAFFDPTFFLLGQLSKHLLQVLPQVPIKNLPKTLGDKNDVVLALPLRVA
jgi:hypothetical protein